MKGETYKEVITSSFLIALVALTVQGRPRYIECSNTLECGLGYCCVLGNGRYSLPRCLPLGQVNDQCRPIYHPLLNVTVTYPDGESVELNHVYSTMCPCQAGLYCSDKSGYCRDPMEDKKMSRRRTNNYSDIQYEKLPQTEQTYLDSQFQQPSTQNIPWKAICLALLLCIGGAFMLSLGSLILTGHLDSKYDDRMWPVILIGIIMFIPGVYHIRIAIYAYKQCPGYSYDDIPEFD